VASRSRLALGLSRQSALVSVGVVLGVGCMLLCAARCHADPPQDIAALVEPMLRGDPLDLPPEEVANRAHGVQAELASWRQRHPDALPGIIALAQITWVLDRFEPSFVDDGAGPAAAARNVQARQALRQAAARYPERADLPFWEAQLLASPVVRSIDGVLRARPLDLPGAIRVARHAWTLQPDDAQIRDALAELLVEAYQDEEAWELLGPTPQATAPALRRLLADLRSLPLPPQAWLLEEDSRRFAEDQLARGRLQDRIYARARVYVLPGTAADFEALCRTRWPHFRLLSTGREAGAPTWRDHAMQVLLLGGGEPRPVEDPSQLEVSRMDGIALTLIELREPPQEKRQRSPAGVSLPRNLGDTFVYLYVLNERTIH
jgi:hypothetical protein